MGISIVSYTIKDISDNEVSFNYVSLFYVSLSLSVIVSVRDTEF